MKKLEERNAILDAEIIKQQKKGWQVVSRTETNCQLMMNKRPETCLIVALLLLFIIPGIIYLVVSKKTTTVYIEVDEEGKIVYSGTDLSPYELGELNKEYIEANVDGRKLSPYEIEMREKASGSVKKPSPQVPITNNATNDLGLLTTKTIADGLKLPEEDVIKLIETNELKGKKIGNKYFVVKEDFDAFMKL
jgi:excisionase family DNA binding protein